MLYIAQHANELDGVQSQGAHGLHLPQSAVRPFGAPVFGQREDEQK